MLSGFTCEGQQNLHCKYIMAKVARNLIFGACRLSSKQTGLPTLSPDSACRNILHARQYGSLLSHKKPVISNAYYCVSRRNAHESSGFEVIDDLVKESEENIKNFTLPSELKGWKLDGKGCQKTLTNSINSAEVKVTINLNDVGFGYNDMDDARDDPYVQEGLDKTELDRQGASSLFTFDIKHPSGDILSVVAETNMDGTEQQAPEAGEEEMPYDNFNIGSFSVHSGDEEKAYYIKAETLNDELYNLLMDTLDSYGITNEFMTALVKYSDNFEEEKFVGTLNKLKKFIK